MFTISSEGEGKGESERACPLRGCFDAEHGRRRREGHGEDLFSADKRRRMMSKMQWLLRDCRTVKRDVLLVRIVMLKVRNALGLAKPCFEPRWVSASLGGGSGLIAVAT